MKNKKVRKYYTYIPGNQYNLGGLFSTMGKGLNAIGGSAGRNGGANMVANLAGGLINSSGLSTGLGGAMNSIGSLASNIPGVGGLIGAGVNLLGSVVNAGWGSKLNQENIQGIQNKTTAQAGINSNAQSNEALLGDLAGLTMLSNVKKSDVGTDGWFSNKAQKKTNQLNAEITNANMLAQNNLFNRADNIQNYNALNTASQFFKYGGMTNGTNFTNGVIEFDNGGTHEENPNGGVIIGMDEQGVPNLVEEGEVKWNNYIFSNSMRAKRKDLEQVGLSPNYDRREYAKIAKDISKESDERPNDPISKNGLLNSMTKLMVLQEMERAKKKPKNTQQGNMFVWGGPADKPFNPSIDFLHAPQQQTSQNNWWDIATNYTIPESSTKNKKGSGKGLNALRYAPVLGGVLGVTTDLLGITNKPDYSGADLIAQSVAGIQDVNFNPIGNYMTYNPMDRDYYINKLQGQQAASRRALTNQAGGNRATAMAGILASDYGMGQGLGNLARQAEEYNLNQRQMVAGFNRATDQFNAEGNLRAASLNRQKDDLKLRAAMAQADIRDRQRMLSSQAKSANLTNLFDSLGDVGRENVFRDQVNWEIQKGLHGNLDLKDIMGLKGLTRDEKLEMARRQGWTDSELKERGYFRNGGRINTRKKGLTF